MIRMDNLLDNIKRFKTARQMTKKPVEKQSEIDNMVKMYESIGPGNDSFKQNFIREWNKLPEKNRSELVNQLIKFGLLSQKVGCVLEIFCGKVVSLV